MVGVLVVRGVVEIGVGFTVLKITVLKISLIRDLNQCYTNCKEELSTDRKSLSCFEFVSQSVSAAGLLPKTIN